MTLPPQPSTESGVSSIAEPPERQFPLNGSLSSTRVSERFLDLISRDFAREHLIVSQGTDNDQDREFLVHADVSDPCALFNVAVRLGVSAWHSTGDPEAIARVIDEAYEQRAVAMSPSENADRDLDDIEDPEAVIAELARIDDDLLSTSGKAPVVRLVDALLFEALGRGASDVHIQPLKDRARVRYRVDGLLHNVRELTVRLAEQLISRIKIMGRMDIAERRVPQDGRASVSVGNRIIDLRISTLPTSYGERAVIRLLDHESKLCDFDRLGMPPEVARAFIERAHKANGMILVTGPTGSGKTTTLYSTLRKIITADLNAMTIEDPIEYELSTVGLAISQSQVNRQKGVTFASGLRHILRQDPDVVMVGEIRDLETARIAIQSSLTGHLVFSTLHTNDAAGAVTRLIDLGVEPYLVAASLSVVLAQRLVRTIHQSCRGTGCDSCLMTGYKGRTGLFEVMEVSDELRDAISSPGAALSVIRATAHEATLSTLRDAGDALISSGTTTPVEVQRVIEFV